MTPLVVLVVLLLSFAVWICLRDLSTGLGGSAGHYDYVMRTPYGLWFPFIHAVLGCLHCPHVLDLFLLGFGIVHRTIFLHWPLIAVFCFHPFMVCCAVCFARMFCQLPCT